MLFIKVDYSSRLSLWLIVPHPPCWRANTLGLLMSRRKLLLVCWLLLLMTLVLYSKHSLLVQTLCSITGWRLKRFYVSLVWFLKVLVILLILLILRRHRDLNVWLLIDGVLVIEFNRFLKLLSLCFTDLIDLILLNFFVIGDGCQLGQCVVVWKVILLTVKFLKQGLSKTQHHLITIFLLRITALIICMDKHTWVAIVVLVIFVRPDVLLLVILIVTRVVLLDYVEQHIVGFLVIISFT